MEAGRGVGGARTSRKSSYSASSSEYIAGSTPGSRPRTRINDDYVHCPRGCARGGRVLAEGWAIGRAAIEEGGVLRGPGREETTASFGELFCSQRHPSSYLVLYYLLESTPTVVVLGNFTYLRPQILLFSQKLPILRPAHSYPRHAQSDSRPLVLTPFGLLSLSTRRLLSTPNIQ